MAQYQCPLCRSTGWRRRNGAIVAHKTPKEFRASITVDEAIGTNAGGHYVPGGVSPGDEKP